MLTYLRNWGLAGGIIAAAIAIGSILIDGSQMDFSGALSRVASAAFSGALMGAVAALMRAFIVWTR